MLSVPFWGLASGVPVLALLLWPTDKVALPDVVAYFFTIALVILVFGVLVWLNLRGASKLTLEAISLK